MPSPSKDVSPVVPAAPVAEQPGCLSLVARIIWLMVGNVVLLGLAVKIVLSRGFSLYDIVFWAVVGAIVFIRYADIKWLKGLGADAQPATMRDWVKHARLLLIMAGGVWVIVHALLPLFHR